MKELGVKLSMEDLDEMMKEADINQDGRIDYAGDCLRSSFTPSFIRLIYVAPLQDMREVAEMQWINIQMHTWTLLLLLLL